MNPFINVGINQVIWFLCVLGGNVGALFGTLGGPLAYWAGVRLGAATFHWPLFSSLALLSVIWALLWTGVMAVAARQTFHRHENLQSSG